MIPESPEVISQTAKHIKRLLVRATKNSDDSTQEELFKQLRSLTEDYNRAGRVAALYAHVIVRKLHAKAQANGAEKMSGIDMELDHEPLPFEVAYITYLNHMIGGDVGDAAETFAQMVATESDESIQSFILALAKFSVLLS